MKYLEELRLYESGLTENQIAEQLDSQRSTIQSRLNTFRKAGVLTGSHKSKDVAVNWQAVQHTADVLPDTAPIPQKAAQNTADAPPGAVPDTAPAPQKAVQRTALPFTAAEIDALKRVAQRELPGETKRSGQISKTSLRLDTGLVQALREQAKMQRLSVTELVHRAIETYL